MKMKSPGGDDVFDRLSRLERRLNEAGRGSAQRDRAKIYIGRTAELIDGEQRLHEWWFGIPEIDTADMVRVNVPTPEGNATYFRIPYAGRWRVRLDAAVDVAFGNSGGEGFAGTWLKLNDDVSTGWNPSAAIGYDSRYVYHTPGVSRIFVETEQFFNQDDHVSFGFWSTKTRTIRLVGVTHPDPGFPQFPRMPTYASIEFVGAL